MSITKKEFSPYRHSYQFQGQEFVIESGVLAPQADGAIVISYGDNKLLVTSVLEPHPNPNLDFLPLMIDYRESYSAAGKIGWAAYRRREAKPSDNLTLYARLTDRALRPLFPEGMINGIVVSITPLSIDNEQDLWVLSLLWSSLACLAAWLPLDGPVGAVRIGRIDGKFIINPTLQEIEDWEMNLICAGHHWSINMIELDAKLVSDEVVSQAFDLAQSYINEMVEMQRQYLSKLTISPKEVVYNKPSPELLDTVQSLIGKDVSLRVFWADQQDSLSQVLHDFEQLALEHLASEIEDDAEQAITPSTIKMAIFEVVKKALRDRTINEGLRVDDRTIDQIRPLYTQVDIAPRAHGTGLFRRGDTQVLSSLTLGTMRDALLLDDMEHTDIEQRYFHHYNFPPFSVGEAKPIRFVSRREIGHGKLAEKALEPVLPSKDEFPYTIRVVSDCLSSGGSTSMGATCGSTLALMAAWVPISAPVSGIAMGLISEQDDQWNIIKYSILTDLMGTEDFMGDMDFKVAGTSTGITAIQLDTKVKWLSLSIIKETIARAHTARNEILEIMLDTIAEPRSTLSPYAPKLSVIKIDPDKVKLVIGKWGETIDKIIEASGGVKIDFEEDGTCYIAHTDQEKIDHAIALIRDIADDLPLHTPITWTIAKVEKFWFFIDLPKRESWLVHTSQLGELAKPSVEANFKQGQEIKVIVSGKDDKWRLKLSLASS